MRDLYEDLWAQRTEPGEPYAWELRRSYLLERVKPGERALDLGCGDGAFTGALAGAGVKALGLDIAEAALERARAAHPGLRFALTPPHGPFPAADASFDVVWASEVIEHVADTARWLSEVRRVLVAGGRLLLSTPYHGRVKSLAIAVARFDSHYDPVGEHLRFYTRGSLSRLLDDFGFEIASLATARGLPLLREMLLAEARKPAGSTRSAS